MNYMIHVFYGIFAFCWYIKGIITVFNIVSFLCLLNLFLFHVFNDALITSFCLSASLCPSRKRHREK